ncbi:hypothetical protein IUY40_00155 [Flavobacterium sp. ALJ2]|uniref:hypothetical protein n=1 Tax=Flavobacterium sp. ALJ2 TaxID=2786960 RepID=UPI00189D4034|nr:hypothetical protein [Flavobacterium sp. ALJ2]MBF7089961.1 hypothetical protein [Flavobacterium sp. ALJ2]
MDEAILRGDNFRFVSNPNNPIAIYVTGESGNFVLDTSGKQIQSIFGREIEYFKSKGYKILNNGTAVK